jgi:hypothetical protein
MAAGAALTVPKKLLGGLLDAFLLRAPEKVVIAREVPQQEAVARDYAAAQRRIRVARDLHESSEAVAAITLYREAAVLLIAALQQSIRSEPVTPGLEPTQAWRELEALALPAGHSNPPPRFDRARALLATNDVLAADALAPADLAEAVSASAETVGWLSSAVEPRTVREIRATRVLRLVGLALLVVYLLFKATSAMFPPKNLALHKPAGASSQRPGSPTADGVDNGEIERTYGVHTNIEANPWVQIDLGAVMPVREVRVYGRGDGWQSEVVPLVLQFSDDGQTFADIARRDTQCTQDDPWVTKVSGKRARVVRVTMPRTGYIALAEIEVF